ncbi:unnamed protein product [Plutella xylostella]|uniref:(diamondback moth) hypothetical protein n=1 Tax=Plutella xylostella TaxID=51655 RepID=A0A8S4G6R5_PLUXY|nr:unnamed protein product [Plutella xylostella]
MSKDQDSSAGEAQESLLYSARHGELSVVKAMLEAREEGKLTLDINCKGQSKSNLGWTPLHLATYFGHADVVQALLEAGADVDEVNETGDTALHKACFIGNEELVILLLNHKADVNIMNGEGRTPSEVCKTGDVRRLVDAAARAERLRGERALLTAAREGNIEDIQQLLSGPYPPNINCVDAVGNSSLHCAAYRGHARVAVLLLQNGVDTTVRNNSGQLAVELAKDSEMREVLSVRPVQRLQRAARVEGPLLKRSRFLGWRPVWERARWSSYCELSKDSEMREVLSVRPVQRLQRAARVEGPLLKRSRFLGWRPVWAVLQRGVLLYYGSRAEAAREGGRYRAKQYLDGARVTAPDSEPALIVVNFSDGDMHRIAMPQGEKDVVALRQYLDGARVTAPDSEPALIVVNFSDGDMHRLAMPQGEKDVVALRQYLDGARVTAPDSEPALIVVNFSDGDMHRLAMPQEEKDVVALRQYLDGARVTAPDSEPALIVVNFSGGDMHRLAMPQGEKDVVALRQTWITALQEHIAYSGHYLWAGASPDSAKEATEDLEDESKPLGSMQDALTAATNSLALLESQLRECGAIVGALEKSVSVGNTLHQSAYMRFQHVCGTGAEALSSLRHCAALVTQARDADQARLNRELERNRVLEEALAALARTHHALEMSVAEELTNKSKRKKKLSVNESKENFFDVYDDDSDEDDTLVTAGLNSPLGALSPWSCSPELTRRTPQGSDGERTPTNEDLDFLHHPLDSSGSQLSLHTAPLAR